MSDKQTVLLPLAFYIFSHISSWKTLIFNIPQWVWLLEQQNAVLPTDIKAKQVMVGWRASKTRFIFRKRYYLSLLAYLNLFLNLSNKFPKHTHLQCIFLLLEFQISYQQEHIDFSFNLVVINILVHFEEATSEWVFF